MGYVGWIDTFEGEKGSGKERRFESQIVRDLRSLGAIPFAKVSICQYYRRMRSFQLTCVADNSGTNSEGKSCKSTT
jgi:hypothetical protein